MRDRVAELIARRGVSVTLREVADALRIHPRALQRRLQRKRISFRDLVSLSRRDAVLRAVALANEPVREIARNAGFSSMAGFYKAFRRWTGATPSQWRSQAARVTAGFGG